MKRRIAFILTMVTVAGCMLTGCGNKETGDTTNVQDTQVAVESEVETEDTSKESTIPEEQLDHLKNGLLGDNYNQESLAKFLQVPTGRLATAIYFDNVEVDGNTVTAHITNSDVNVVYTHTTDSGFDITDVYNTKGEDYPVVLFGYAGHDVDSENVYQYADEVYTSIENMSTKVDAPVYCAIFQNKSDTTKGYGTLHFDTLGNQVIDFKIDANGVVTYVEQ